MARQERRREPAPDADLLVERARRGDRRAFDDLVEAHMPQVWKVVWRILRHSEDTEDVVQEVFLAAHRSLPGYRGDARFSTWLHRIAVNKALNHRGLAAERMRRQAVSLDAPAGVGEEEAPADRGPASAAPSPLEELEMSELKRRLADCLELLPPPMRAALALRDAEGMSYEEIAAVLKVALGTVRSRLARARMGLRDCIDGRTS